MALRNILNHSFRHGSTLQKLKQARHFSSSTIPENLYKQSVPLLSTPWLMLPPDVKDGQNGPTDNYFNILDKTMVKIDRQLSHGNIPCNTICVGTTQGWVVFSCDSDNSVFLAHPYKEGCSIKLPPYHRDKYRTGLNCILAGNPISKRFALLALEDLQAVGIHVGNSERWGKQAGLAGTESVMAYSKNNDTMYKLQWRTKSGPLKITCWDLLPGHGPLKIGYWDMLDVNGGTQSFEFKDATVDGLGKNEQTGRVFSSFMDLELDSERAYPYNYDTVKFLVVGEEPGKQEPVLFLVIRYIIKEEGVRSETKGIQLLRIDLERGKVEYVSSLGDRALFIGTNSEPFFLSTSECPAVKSNSVYIADDLGVYDMETRCVTPFLSLGDLANIRPQVYWLAPRSFL